MTLQVDELRSARTRAESERALSDHKLEVAKERQRDLIDLVDVKFGVLAGLHGELQRQHGAIRQQYSEMRRDIEELREGLREIKARIGEED